MCGIFCLLSPNNEKELAETYKEFEQNLSKRGPNYQNTERHKTETTNLLISASVLHLQGAEITHQPITTPNSIFVYNGDIYNETTIDYRKDNGDTRYFHNLLQNTKIEGLIDELEQLQGGYAFIYCDKTTNRLIFGRDSYGRRSLLLGKYKNKIILTSVAKRHTNFDFIELPSIGIFIYDFKTFLLKPWRRKNSNFDEKLRQVEALLNVTVSVLTDSVSFKLVSSFVEPTDSDLALFTNLGNQTPDNTFVTLLNDKNWLNNVEILIKLLKKSVEKRVNQMTSNQCCQLCYQQKVECHHAKIGVLFSGGIDCAILALLLDHTIRKDEPIDLINVAFNRCHNFNTPDRLTSFETIKELEKLSPNRKYNFVEVNTTMDELSDERETTIGHLITPLTSILDDSLGCALYFASKATTLTYKSPARILLAGMGADELFGGYSRHRTALRTSWKVLHEVLAQDFDNLSFRNLARDDRVCSHHGRQLRTPYLDEEVVEWTLKLPSWMKTWPGGGYEPGIGEKILLRSVGYKLGLRNAAGLKKRALQFGSRIANPKEKGCEVSLNL